MRASTLLASLALACGLLAWPTLLSPSARAQATAADQPPYEATIAPASNEGARAIAKFRIPEGFRVELFAAEPMLANPVCLALDERNRIYVAETFRLHSGVTDNRKHLVWLDDDLASRTVADRVAMYRKHLSPQEFAGYGVDPDRIRLLEDRDGDGKADHATVYADGFNSVADGIGAGLLARQGDVYYTCIPALWRLQDADGDGRADSRQPLHKGYGVHVAFLGHDLHGLRMGPDGRLYFSIGDRGLNVQEGSRSVVNLDSGAILRCNPDGSELEIVANGLRNPQELVFDEHGNLFTGDNNSDGGDKARWVHVVEGGDSGWRIGYQYMVEPVTRGPWNAEKLWHPHWDGQAAYLVPPIANIADGPSGLTYDPGTGLPERYRRHFFLADFRGGTSSQSGIRSFAVQPKGASFDLVDPDQFLWSVLPTDIDFGTDGALYVSDWVEGWNKPGKGRIYKVFAPALAHDKTVLEVKTILAEGMARRTVEELARLLAHPDQRVRQEAQFALAAKGRDAITTLAQVAERAPNPLARLHALWGLGQIGRTTTDALKPILSRLTDGDAEVRAQSAKVLGDARAALAFEGLLALLKDDSPRVRFFAAIALGRLGRKEAVSPLLRVLRVDAGRDPYLRHAAVMGLVGIRDVEAMLVAASATDVTAPERMGVLLALRRLGHAEVARFLDDPEPALVVEAARAIYDVPIEGAMPSLAAIASRRGVEAILRRPELVDPLLRRAINANRRVAGDRAAGQLVGFARLEIAPEPMRIEALDLLAAWAQPSGLDRVLGLWRPLAPRSGTEAATLLRPAFPELLTSAPDPVRMAAARAVGALVIREVGPALRSLLADGGRSGSARAEAVRALAALDDPHLLEAARQAGHDQEEEVRIEGQRILARLEPVEAVAILDGALGRGGRAERQAALTILGGMAGPSSDQVLSRWLDQLLAGTVAADMQLDLLEAAARRQNQEIRHKLERFEAQRSKADPLARFRESLVGGDERRGRKVFSRVDTECSRCHMIRRSNGEGLGGEVGPDLTDVGARQSREVILESIVAPNRQISQGFETVVVATTDGKVSAGVFKGDDGKNLLLKTPQGFTLVIPKGEIEEQTRGASAMPEELSKALSKVDLRDLVEFLANQKGQGIDPR